MIFKRWKEYQREGVIVEVFFDDEPAYLGRYTGTFGADVFTCQVFNEGGLPIGRDLGCFLFYADEGKGWRIA